MLDNDQFRTGHNIIIIDNLGLRNNSILDNDSYIVSYTHRAVGSSGLLFN